MRWLPISFIVLFAVLLVAMVWKANSPAPAPAPAPPVQVGPAAAPPAPPSYRPGHAPPPLARTSAGLPASRAASRERIDRTVKAGRQRLQAQFSAERADPAWAMGREQDLAAHSTSPQIASLHLDADNFRANCRSSICRVTADFDNRSNAEDWFALFLTNTGTGLGHASYQLSANPDGSTHIEVYGTARD